MSKFDFGIFYGGYDEFAVSKEKYSKEEAIKMALQEFEHRKHKYLAIGESFVKHRAGINESGEPCVGWWIEYRDSGRNCPAYIFHTTPDKDRFMEKNYEHIEFTGGTINENRN